MFWASSCVSLASHWDLGKFLDRNLQLFAYLRLVWGKNWIKIQNLKMWKNQFLPTIDRGKVVITNNISIFSGGKNVGTSPPPDTQHGHNRFYSDIATTFWCMGVMQKPFRFFTGTFSAPKHMDTENSSSIAVELHSDNGNNTECQTCVWAHPEQSFLLCVTTVDYTCQPNIVGVSRSEYVGGGENVLFSNRRWSNRALESQDGGGDWFRMRLDCRLWRPDAWLKITLV